MMVRMSRGEHDATIKTLTAEVQTLVIGSRQVTMSVYNQLDEIAYNSIKPFGRVHPPKALRGWLYVVGRDEDDGTLVRSVIAATPTSLAWQRHERLAQMRDWLPGVDSYLLSSRTAGEHATYGAAAEKAARGMPDGILRLLVLHEAWTAFTYAGNASPKGQGDEFFSRAREIRLQVHKELSIADAWEQLPLIVLAGLR